MLLPTASQKIVRLIVFSFSLLVTLGGGILLGILGISVQRYDLLIFSVFMNIFSILPIIYLKSLLDGTYDMDEETEYENAQGNG